MVVKKYDKIRELMFKDRQTYIDEQGDYWAVGSMENYTGAVKGIAIDKLADLENKIENGTLIELPCKVGDTIYMPWEYDGASAVAELTVNDMFLDINIDSSSIQTDLESDDAKYMRKYSYGLFKFEDIGEKIFLTKAEAEQRLKELKDENNCKV